MASYSKEFLIEIQPTLTKDSAAKMTREVQQLTKKIKGSEQIIVDADFKFEDRKVAKKLKKDIQQILGTTKNISANMDLGEFELDTKELDVAKKKLKEYKTLINDPDMKKRADANYLEFPGVEKELEKMKKIQKEIQTLDPSNADDIKRGTVLIKKYNEAANSLARRGWEENAFTTDLKGDLISQNQTRQMSSSVNLNKMNKESMEVSLNMSKINEKLFDMSAKSKNVDEVSDKLDEVSNSAKKVEGNVNKANNATSNSDGNKNLKDTKKHTDSLGESFKKMARWSLVAFAWRELGQQLRGAIQYIKELDVALTEISVVTGKSRQQMEALSKEFNAMASRLGRTTAEVTKASMIFFRQGKTTEEVMKLVEASTIAASVAHIDLAEASDYLTSTLNGFQMKAEEAMIVVDKFSAVGASAGTSFEEMAQALKKVAASANNANVDMDHMISYLATVSEVTREAPENIGTSFKTLFARMQKIKDGDMPKELNKVDSALQSIGISLVDQEGQIDSLQTIVEKLGSKWKGLTKNQQAYIATSIAGTRQQVRFISLMDNYNRSLEILETSLDSSGEAQIQFGQYLEGIEASLKEFKAAIENLYSTMIDTDKFKGFIDILIDLSFRVQSLVDDFGVLGTMALGLSTIIGGKLLFSFISNLGLFESLTTTVIPGLVTEIAGVTTMTGAFNVATGGAVAVLTALKTSFLALLGVTWPLIAIGAAAYAVHEALDKVHYSVGEVNEDLKEFRDLDNELNRLNSGKKKIEEYEELNKKLEDGNLTLEERKELLEDIERLELEIAGSIKNSGTSFNKQGEAIATDMDKARKALQEDLDRQIINTDAELEENKMAFAETKRNIMNYEKDMAYYQNRKDEIQNGVSHDATIDYFGTLDPESYSPRRFGESAAEFKALSIEDIDKRMEKLRDDKQRVETQEEETSGWIIKWLSINDKDLDYLIKTDIDKLSKAEQIVKSYVNERGSEEEIVEYNFTHNILPSKNIEKDAEGYAKDFWNILYDSIDETKGKDDLLEKLKRTSEEDISNFLKTGWTGSAKISGFLSDFIKNLDLEDLTTDQKIIAITEALERFNIVTVDIKNSASNIDIFKQSVSSLGDVKSEYNTMVEILEGLGDGLKELNVEQMETLSSMYPNIPAEVATSGEAAIKFLKEKMKISETVAKNAYSRLLMVQDDFTDATHTKVTNALIEEAESLNLRIDNYDNVAQYIEAITDEINSYVFIYDKLGGPQVPLDMELVEGSMDHYNSLITHRQNLLNRYKIDIEELRNLFKKKDIEIGGDTSNIWDIVDAEIAWWAAKYDVLETEDDLANKTAETTDNIKKRIALEKYKQKLMNQVLDTMDDGIEKFELQEKIAKSINDELELSADLSKLFAEGIQDQKDLMLEKVEEAKEAIIEAYEEEHEKKMELENEAYEDFMNKNNEEIEALREKHKEEDYKKDLKDMEKEKQKVQDRINEYELIGTEASRKKIKELKEEESKLEEEIEEKKLDKTRELEINALEEIGESKSDAHEENLENIDEEHEEVVSNIKNEFNLAETSVNKLKELTKNFGSESQTAINSLITDIIRLQSEYDNAQGKMKTLSKLERGYVNTPESKNRLGYQTMSPEDMITMIENKLAYENAESKGEEIDSTWGEENRAIRKDNNVISDKLNAQDLAAFFEEWFGKDWKEYSSGGISTTTQFAKLHGTTQKPEFIFNYDQMSAMSDLINTGGSNISIGSLVNVEGNITDGNVNQVTSAVESGIEKLRRAISDKGKLTRISGAYL